MSSPSAVARSSPDGPALPLFIATVLALTVSRVAVGQGPPPDYGIDFVTVGAPGNVAASPIDYPDLGDPFGAVDHDYRIARTELTVAQWFPFVQAYSAVNPN